MFLNFCFQKSPKLGSGFTTSPHLVLQPWLKAVLRIRIRILMFLGNPDPLVRGTDPDPSIIMQKSWKIVKKTFISTVQWLFSNCLSLKNDANAPKELSKKIRKDIIIFCWGLEGHSRKEQDMVRIWICLSEVWIRGSESVSKCHESGTLVKCFKY
jgi:hypothetical protein